MSVFDNHWEDLERELSALSYRYLVVVLREMTVLKISTNLKSYFEVWSRESALREFASAVL